MHYRVAATGGRRGALGLSHVPRRGRAEKFKVTRSVDGNHHHFTGFCIGLRIVSDLFFEPGGLPRPRAATSNTSEAAPDTLFSVPRCTPARSRESKVFWRSSSTSATATAFSGTTGLDNAFAVTACYGGGRRGGVALAAAALFVR